MPDWRALPPREYDHNLRPMDTGDEEPSVPRRPVSPAFASGWMAPGDNCARCRTPPPGVVRDHGHCPSIGACCGALGGRFSGAAQYRSSVRGPVLFTWYRSVNPAQRPSRLPEGQIWCSWSVHAITRTAPRRAWAGLGGFLQGSCYEPNSLAAALPIFTVTAPSQRRKSPQPPCPTIGWCRPDCHWPNSDHRD